LNSKKERSVRTFMRILVSNDDGIFSPGLVALAEVAEKFGEVLVVAPDVEQSAMGQAITIQRPLTYHRTSLKSFSAYRVNGTPADCVALGLYRWGGADLVLSGVNLGTNMGSDIWHSGTVAAAKQASLLGVQAAAFSMPVNGCEPDFEPLKEAIENSIGIVLDQDHPLINVNLPGSNVTGYSWTRQSVRAYNGAVVPAKDPRGREHYWFVATPLTEPEEGSDRWALERGMVSLTPLRLDLTDELRLENQLSAHKVKA
jgi:5'-nucleotidase